ncbi:hypothetical protein, partial [Caballeronia sp. BR00000012568055]|uniref:hypothetical protein n=1 Tax=Caballeronia sp. BR00000012568055 TaxID=2918761 RepID=UPI0023F97A02
KTLIFGGSARTNCIPRDENGFGDAENFHSHRAKLQSEMRTEKACESARKPRLSDEQRRERGKGNTEKKLERLPLAKPLLVLRMTARSSLDRNKLNEAS